jgi:transposase
VFVRQKRNKTGSISVQIIEKIDGRYRMKRSVGVGHTPAQVEELENKARSIIVELGGQVPLFADDRDALVEGFLGGVSNEQVRMAGPELVFGKRYDAMGYGAIRDELLRHLVIARLAFPGSKLKTVDYLRRYQGIELGVDRIYRHLDKIDKAFKQRIEEITHGRTKELLGGRTSIVFYDMTTLHFEADDEDDLRRIGYSKSGKHQHPQIQLGLLVGMGGLPIGYDMFPGNLFEGKTLLPVLKRLEQRFALQKPVVVADAGLLSRDNIEGLQAEGYHYILGGRIKNESQAIKERILAAELTDGQHAEFSKGNDVRLIVQHSDKRAGKDLRNRQRGLARLQAAISAGKLTKSHINNKGYNKYLRLVGDLQVEIDLEKFQLDAPWDGMKGYITNSKLKASVVMDQYRELWHIEKAFRMSKTDLKVRPVHHYLSRRIEAHLCVAFMAYAVMKDLELQLRKNGSTISIKRACELTHNMYQVIITLPYSRQRRTITLALSDEQKLLLAALN